MDRTRLLRLQPLHRAPQYLWAVHILLRMKGTPFRELSGTHRHWRPLSTLTKPAHSLSPVSAYNYNRSQLIKSPASKKTLVWRRCRGIRKSDGHRCDRRVKADVLCIDENELYCFSHRPAFQPIKMVNETTHAECTTEPKRKVKTKDAQVQNLYDCWLLWIGKHIKPRIRKLLKQEIQKPISEHDEPGYIYAYILNKGPRVSNARYAYFKIGRTTQPHRRIYQVSQRCKYDPKVLEIFPSLPSHGQRPKKIQPESMIQCPISHRVERLIHLELSGIYPTAGFRCNECGTAHREWFRVARPRRADGTPATDKEIWVDHVRPIILRWIQYAVAVSTTLPPQTTKSQSTKSTLHS